MDEHVSIHRATYTLFEGILDQGVPASYRKGERVSFVHFEWVGIKWIAYVYEYVKNELQVYRLKVTFDTDYKMSFENRTKFVQALKSMKEKPSFEDLEFAFMPDEALELMQWYAKVMFYSKEEVKELGIPCLPYPIRMDYEELASELNISTSATGWIPPIGNTMTEAACKMVKKHQDI